jgi:hypothetical protein
LLDRHCAPRDQPSQTLASTEALIAELRASLARESALGFIGAEAIAAALSGRLPAEEVPSIRTIGRILVRLGLLDARKRVRRAPPPTGWHLPAVAARAAEVDAFDCIEDLPIEGVGLAHILTAKSLLGPLVGAWAAPKITAAFVIEGLTGHWQKHGLPTFAHFDNDTRFQGPHNRPNVIGAVILFCLRLGVTPVFAPPRETGFQADIEGFNALWQAKVWRRFHHLDFATLQGRSDTFCAAYTALRAARSEHALARRAWPRRGPAKTITQGTLIFIRRTSETGSVRILERSYEVAAQWPHRLVRCELNVITLTLRFYRLRRREPARQPLLKKRQLIGSLSLKQLK